MPASSRRFAAFAILSMFAVVSVRAQRWIATEQDWYRVGDLVAMQLHAIDAEVADRAVRLNGPEGERIEYGATDEAGRFAVVFESAGAWEVEVASGEGPVILPLEVLPRPRQRARLAFWLPVGIGLIVLSVAAWRRSIRKGPSRPAP